MILLFISSLSFSQSYKTYDSTAINKINDTVERYMRRHPWKFSPKQNRPAILPLLSLGYSQEKKFEAAIGMITLYRNGIDTTANVSSFLLYGTISTDKSFSFNCGGINISPNNKFEIAYNIGYSKQSNDFWGIGFENGSNNSNLSSYTINAFNSIVDFSYNINGQIKLGSSIGFDYYNTHGYSKPELISGHPLYYKNINLGLFFKFNSLDNQISPEKGVFISISQLFYPGFIFQCKPFYKTNITTDFFTKVWKGGVLAFDIYGEFNYGDSPWLFWGEIGGSERMRGYYQGRYKDRNIAFIQMELRQNIYREHGIAIWGGAGNIFHSFDTFKIKETLPTYGAGYRLNIAGIIVRLDVGFGINGQYSIIAGINQSF